VSLCLTFFGTNILVHRDKANTQWLSLRRSRVIDARGRVITAAYHPELALTTRKIFPSVALTFVYIQAHTTTSKTQQTFSRNVPGEMLLRAQDLTSQNF